MKKIIFLLLLSIAALASGNLSASELASFPTIKMDGIPTEKKLSVVIYNLKENHIIELQDDKAMVLMEVETGTDQKFAKLLNLKSLPDGTYYIVINGRQRRIVQPIVLSESGVRIDEYRKRVYYKPFVKVSDAHIDVSLFNGRIATVIITILDKNNDVVFTEKLENIITVERRYQMKDFPYGEYTIKVITPEDSYLETFFVR